jgi:hypothetical protein
MIYKDKLVLDIEDDDKMKDYLGTKGVGDECSFTLKVSMNERTDTQAVFDVKDIVINTYGDESEEGQEPEGDESMPVMMVMGKAKGKKDY